VRRSIPYAATQKKSDRSTPLPAKNDIGRPARESQWVNLSMEVLFPPYFKEFAEMSGARDRSLGVRSIGSTRGFAALD
jgi:hypothetical protein